jgi:hypothetical protein
MQSGGLSLRGGEIATTRIGFPRTHLCYRGLNTRAPGVQPVEGIWIVGIDAEPFSREAHDLAPLGQFAKGVVAAHGLFPSRRSQSSAVG